MPAIEQRQEVLGLRSDIRVRVATEADRLEWDAFVATHREACAYHDWAWRGVFERSFGHEAVYLIAREVQSDRTVGVLPLVDMRSLVFGRFLTSLPFVNYGGVAAESDAAASALVEEAAAHARERHAGHVELRHRARRFPHLPFRQHKVAMELAISPGLWDVLDRKVRNQIRKATKSGLSVSRGGVELVGAFYSVFARNMRDLGTPVYSRRFFEEILQAFPDRARVIVVRLDGRPAAAGISIRTGSLIEVPWASSVRDYSSLCPNHLLYWHVIETAVAEGCDRLDFGRSTPGGGTFRFKEQWGAVAVPLHWEYAALAGGEVPDQGPTNPRLGVAVAVWKHLPLWVANRVGPAIVRGIP